MRLLLGLWLALYATLAAAGPQGELAKCLHELPSETMGLAALEAACPDLRATLTSRDARALVAAQPEETLTGPAVGRMLPLLEPRAAGKAPDPSTVSLALAGLSTSIKTSGWWESFKAWLRQLLARDDSAAEGWLSRWLAKLSLLGVLAPVLLVALLALVVALAAWLVVRELRAAGFLGRSAARGERRVWREPGLPSRAARSVAEMLAAPLADRPRLLLGLVIAALAAAGRLRGERSLTHGELAARVVLEDEAARGSFARLASLTEQQVYGAGEVPAAQIEPVLAAGIVLYEKLGAARPA